PHLGPYSASKFALKGFSESLAAELHADGIAITTVCPGIMRTGGHLNSTYKGRHEHEYAWMNAFNLIPGLSVSAEHAARTIADAAAAPDPPPELVIGFAARAAAKVHGLAPAAFARFNTLANRLLPRPGGIGQQHITG